MGPAPEASDAACIGTGAGNALKIRCELGLRELAAVYLCRRNTRYIERSETVHRQGGGTIHIDAAAGIFDHHDIEALTPRVFTRVAHAKIKGEADYKNSDETAFA